MKNIIFYTIVIINIVAAALFIYDKEASTSKNWRVRNWIMKLFVFLGPLGVHVVVLFSRHKARKFKRIFELSRYIAGMQLLFIIWYFFIQK